MGARGPHAKPARAKTTSAKPRRTRRKTAVTRAERVMVFLEGLTITSGAQAGKRLHLRPWQREVLEAVYAPDSAGRRVVRTALLSLGRKAGKSTISAGLALAHLAGPEAVPRGQIVVAAADRNQASIIYAEVKAFALADPELADRLLFREWNKTIEDTLTGSTFATASSDAKKAHGMSPVVFIADELAQWRSGELLDALQTGQGAHAEPLGIVISTRSPDPDSPLEALIRYGGQLRDGLIEDPSFASFVWSAPADADPWARETWLLANPDATAERLADIEVQARRASRIPSLEAAFRAYVLNQAVAPDDRFISASDWDACAGTAEASGPMFGGLDLASGANDLSAIALYWPETGRLTVRGFIPREVLAEKVSEDRAPYDAWAAAGHVVLMPGRAIDRTWLLEWIARETEGVRLDALACDRWGLADLQAVADREGIRLPFQAHGVGYKDMTPALQAFESAVLDLKLWHGGNPLLRWAVANAAVDMDPAGGRKLNKQRARGRIDPLAAAVLAVSAASRQPAAPRYEFTGLVVAD